MNYIAPLWLPGGNLQTIWPALYARRVAGVAVRYRRERWTAPDGDFVDVDFLGSDGNAPLVVLFHGLEGGSRSHYAVAFAREAARRVEIPARDWACADAGLGQAAALIAGAAR